MTSLALADLNRLVARRLSLDAAAIRAIGQCSALSRVTLRGTSCPVDALEMLSRDRPDIAIDR